MTPYPPVSTVCNLHRNSYLTSFARTLRHTSPCPLSPCHDGVLYEDPILQNHDTPKFCSNTLASTAASHPYLRLQSRATRTRT